MLNSGSEWFERMFGRQKTHLHNKTYYQLCMIVHFMAELSGFVSSFAGKINEFEN